VIEEILVTITKPEPARARAATSKLKNVKAN
jgi:hypothetical protein